MASLEVYAPDWKVMALVDNLYELQKLFWRELAQVVNDPTVQIRLSWPKNGAPDWKITDNVIFIQVTEESGEDITQPIDSAWADKQDDLVLRDAMTRVVKLALTAYGDRAYSLLAAIRYRLTKGSNRLRKKKLFLIPAPSSIQSVPELFQGRWWPRSDLFLRFNSLIVFETDIKTIKEINIDVKPTEDKIKVKKV